MGNRQIAIVCGLLMLVGVAPVHAQGPVQEAEESKDDEARELFYRGEVHYAAARYRRAAMLFEEAYELSGRSELLFNIANAYERLGEYRTAAKYLRQYVTTVKPKDSTAIRLRIARLEERDAERMRVKEEQLEEIVANREKKKETNRLEIDADKDPGLSATKKVGYVALAGGGAGLVGALVFGVASASARRDANALCNGQEVCPASAKAAQTREKRFALMTDVSAVFGVASAGVGVYLLWRDAKADDKPEPRASRKLKFVPSVYEGGAGIGFRTNF